MATTYIPMNVAGDTTEGTWAEERFTELSLLDDNGHELYNFHLHKDGSLEVSTHGCAKLKGSVLDSSLTIRPIASNRVIIARDPYAE